MERPGRFKGGEIVLSLLEGWLGDARALTLSGEVAAFRPTRTFDLLVRCDFYPSWKVVSCFKGAVPPLTNSFNFFARCEGLRPMGMENLKG